MKDQETLSPSRARRSWGAALRRRLLGAPRSLADPRLFHHLSLVAFLAWVGLGADGLSSSAYGPEEAYKALGEHRGLSLILILMTAVTILIISTAYANLIAKFPGGGGGYLVASKMLGPRAGLVSGCALLVDYVLTIAVSVASACDQIWSFLPAAWLPWKLPAALAGLGLLFLVNLRGVKESVSLLAPVFLLFLVTHTFAILKAVGDHLGSIPVVVEEAATDLQSAGSSMGWWPLLLVLLRAYSLGGGTYTGIEAVSNGVATLREPRVQTARRTMALMAISLTFTAGGILLAYLLNDIRPVAGRTMNAELLSRLFGSWQVGDLVLGPSLVVVCLLSEAALLFVAAQAGFLDGPRVLANMALDSWMPHRFAHLSDRLVTHNGVMMMGLAAAAALIYTGGHIGTLVVMYSINVFITFSLTLLGMARDTLHTRQAGLPWRWHMTIYGGGLVLCLVILCVTVMEKFGEGGWVTLLITGMVVLIASRTRSHYVLAREDMRRLDDILIGDERPEAVPSDGDDALDPRAPTAVVCVSGFSGFGLHQVLQIHQWFPGHFRNFIFASAAVADTGIFKGTDELQRLRENTDRELGRYVAWARRHGLRAARRSDLGTEAVTTMEKLCGDIRREYPRSIFFMGRLVFREEAWTDRLLHNETALALQRRLQFSGLQTIVLPVRVLKD
jgi:amino acid transporter